MAEYNRLVGSLNRTPDGYFGETSVYIQPTEIGYARFLSKEMGEECKAFETAIVGLLSP